MNRRAEQRAEQDRNEAAHLHQSVAADQGVYIGGALVDQTEGDQGDEGVLEQIVVERAKKLGEEEGSEAAVF